MQWVTDTVLNWYSFWAWSRAQKFIENNSSSITRSRQRQDEYVKNLTNDSPEKNIFFDADDHSRYLRDAETYETHLKISEAKLRMYEAQRDYHKLIINKN